MDPENRWVKKSETIPWDTIEEKYAKKTSPYGTWLSSDPEKWISALMKREWPG